jgi:hypothetical protein
MFPGSSQHRTFPQPSTARSCDEQPLLRNQKSAELENMPKASSSQNWVTVQFESEPEGFYLGVIQSGAVFQAQRRISGLPGLTRKPNCTTQNNAASFAQTLKPAKLAAKPLSGNILRTTLLASIFCADRTRSKTSKSFRTRILTLSRKKNCMGSRLVAAGIGSLERQGIPAPRSTSNRGVKC